MENKENVESIENLEINEKEIKVDGVEEIQNDVKEIKKSVKKKKKVGRIILNIILWGFFLVVILEAAVGIINMQRINDEKEPIWYLDKNVTKTSKEEKTVYNLGLYKIVKLDNAKQTKTSLKPFFVGD